MNLRIGFGEEVIYYMCLHRHRPWFCRWLHYCSGMALAARTLDIYCLFQMCVKVFGICPQQVGREKCPPVQFTDKM